MMLQFESVVATGSAALDSGIRDTALKTLNGATYLYSLTGPGGGVAVWKLVDGAVPQLVDTEYFSGSITFQVGRTGTPISFGGGDQLILDVDTANGLVGYDLNADGTVGSLRETGTLTGGGDISALVKLSNRVRRSADDGASRYRADCHLYREWGRHIDVLGRDRGTI